MQGDFNPERLQRALSLPIDYYVLKHANQLANVRPVFSNSVFVVYDARDLQNTPFPLRKAR
jgi:hypothetical protein